MHWAGDLARDGRFVINKNTDLEEGYEITVHNPDHQGNTTFAKMVEAGDLVSVLFKYRKLGKVAWKPALTMDSNPMDFSATGLSEDLGYITLAWDAPTNGPGEYEIMIATECKSYGREDVDGFRADILPGAIDRTGPEKFGFIPMRDQIVFGEEMSVVFTEEIDCSLPFSFKVQLIIGIDEPKTDRLTFDESSLKVICEGRKIVVNIRLEKVPGGIPSVLGRTFSLEIGMIDEIGKVTDVYDNSMQPDKIGFKRTFADIDLYSAGASFRLLMENVPCDIHSSIEDLSDYVGHEISSISDVEDTDRIKIDDIHCASENSINARVHVGKGSGVNRGLRNQDQHSIAVYSKIKNLALNGGKRILSTEGASEAVPTFTVSDLRILPGESDLETLKTHPDNIDEERKLKRLLAEAELKTADGESKSASEYASLDRGIQDMLNDSLRNLEKERKVDERKIQAMLNDSLRNLEKERKEDMKSRKEDMKSAFYQSFVLMIICVGFILAAFSHLVKQR